METELHADLVRNYFRHFISVEIDYVQVMDVLLHLPLNDRLHHFEDSVTFAGEGGGGGRGRGGGAGGGGGEESRD